jgi:hypothetical protein
MSEGKLPEITEDDFIDIDDSETEDDPEALANARAKLEERCKSAGIDLEEREDAPFDLYLLFKLRAGRDTHALALTDLEDVNNLLSVPFEDYTGLGNYQGICSYDDDTIEALVVPLNRAFPNRVLFSRLLGRPLSRGLSEADVANFELKLPTEQEGGGFEVSLQSASKALNVLTEGPSRQGLSLAISGLDLSRHEALDLLERVANSILFQIDLMLGIPLALGRRRRAMRRGMPRRRTSAAADLQFPRHEYDKAPISLYWYGRSATGMPLLQFLAYYQVVEFYFPTYSQVEARRKIQNVLKEPSFRADRDTDIARILSAVRSHGGVGFGDERSQLRATLRECVDSEALREFLTLSEDRQDFLSAKTKGLSDHKIPIANVNADLRDDVADRIYDIRCRIVHTKGEGRNGEVELLLPFSKQAEQMHYDIELVEYVAQRTLISSSSPLQI